MKFDFFNRFFSREEKREETIDSSRLRDWLEKNISSRKDCILRECTPLVESIIHNIEEVRKATLKLEKLECYDGMHRKARKIIVSSKPRFIHGVLDTLSTVNKKPQSYDEVIGFNEDLLAAISSLAKLNAGEGRYLPLAFGEEIDSMKRESKKLAENAEDLRRKIGSDVDVLSKARDSLDELEGLRDELAKLNSQKFDIVEKIKTSPSEVSKLERKLGSLHRGGEFRELEKTKRELENVGKELEGIESLIYNCLNPLKRPLKKFRKSAEVGGYAETLKVVDSFLLDPVVFFLSDDRGDLRRMLSEVKGGEFKPKDRDKILSRIESALRIERGDLRDKHSMLSSTREDLKEKMSSFSILEKEKRINEDIETLERRIKEMGEELRRLERKEEDIRNRIPLLREKIENKINETKGCKIKINWSA